MGFFTYLCSIYLLKLPGFVEYRQLAECIAVCYSHLFQVLWKENAITEKQLVHCILF
jgi:hypothetical protein